MKRLSSIIASLLCVLALTSCLRDASPQNEYGIHTETTKMTEAVTEAVTSADTEPIVNDVPTLHKEVIKWTSRHPAPDRIIMSAEDIEAENDRMAEASDSIVDLFAFGDTVSAVELAGMIDRHKVPDEVRYDTDGTEITEDNKTCVRDRMNIGTAESFEVKKGIMTSRGNLRAIPDIKPYRKAPDNPYDSIQQTELAVGTPVLMLYTTVDGEYCFVVSHFYSGWMATEDVAESPDIDLWMSFASPERFICVTDALYRDGELLLDMGCILPLSAAGKEIYRVKVPVRTEDGTLESREIVLPRSSAIEGFLPFTYENYLNQAFKYEGTNYGWGGLDGGVDCSGFVLNVFKCFGFRLPRDTKDQNKIVGSAADVKGKSHEEIAVALDKYVPAAVYYPGHTLLYIGHDADDGKFYFIHAPQIGEKVTVTSKTDLSGMTYIGRLGELPEL